MTPDLLTSLRAAGDPLHLTAATEVEWQRGRVEQLEAIACLNAETTRHMQRGDIDAAAQPFVHPAKRDQASLRFAIESYFAGGV